MDELRFRDGSLWVGDNLAILEEFSNESVDLIYLDPPFNSHRDYRATAESQAAGAAFRDIWQLDEATLTAGEHLAETHTRAASVIATAAMVGDDHDKAYLIFMALRLIALHRVLKPSGSLYLHCDSSMSHSLKLLLDAIFGRDRFRNEIIWHYTGGGRSKRYFSRKHDAILFYTKEASGYVFNVDAIRVPYKRSSGYARSGIVSKAGKVYRPHILGTPADDVWDLAIINPLSKERTGYPTQKPEALLERVILASSNEGDIVLDPFCGSGTTAVVAQRLKRQWIAIDASEKATAIAKERLRELNNR